MAIARVGSAGALSTVTTNSLTPAFGQATTAGNLLIAVLGCDGGGWQTSSSGWIFATNTTAGWRSAVAYKPNCGSAETAPTFTNSVFSTTMEGALSEWSGAATTSPVDQINRTSQISSPLVNANSAADTATDDLCVATFWTSVSKSGTATETPTWTPAGGTASVLATDAATKQLGHLWGGSYLLAGHGGGAADQVSLAYTPSTGIISSVDAAIASFKVASAAPTSLIYADRRVTRNSLLRR